jgi:AraC-like DNA-binding protein
MNLHIKNMVSLRCILVVKAILDELCLSYENVTLGEVKLKHEPANEQRDQMKLRLLAAGLELLEDKRSILVEKIKNVIVDMVHHETQPPKMKHSVYISEKLGYEYGYLSKVFSGALGICIEQFIIAHRIEKAKELLAYDQLNLSEIAWKLHYCSVQHFSHQFKKVTGYPPSQFKRLKDKRLAPLETVGMRMRTSPRRARHKSYWIFLLDTNKKIPRLGGFSFFDGGWGFY